MNWSNNYVGLPYLDLGRTRAGVDCWGLVRLIYSDELGIDLPPYDTISPQDGPRMREAVRHEQATGEWSGVPTGHERPFDVAIMWGTWQQDGKTVGGDVHVGVFAPHRRILHIEKGIGAVCVPMNNPHIARRFRRAFRHEAVEWGN